LLRRSHAGLKSCAISAEEMSVSQPEPRAGFHPDYDALRQEYSYFRYHLPDALVEVDLASLQVLYVNHMAEVLLGVTAEDVAAGLSGTTLIAPEDIHRVLELLQSFVSESRQNGTTYQHSARQDLITVRMIRRDGSSFPGETQSSFLLDERGVPVRMLTLIRDVSFRETRD